MKLPKVLDHDVMRRGESTFKEEQETFIAQRLPWSLCESCDSDVGVFLQYDKQHAWLWYHLGQWFETAYVSDRHWSSPIVLDNRCSAKVRSFGTLIYLLAARIAHYLLDCTVASLSYDM